jgi:hypothetical protein
MNNATLLGLVIAVSSSVACAVTRSGAHPFAGPLPDGTTLDLSGSVDLSLTGELTLTLRDGCLAQHSTADGHKTVNVACAAVERNAIRVIAVPPWQAASQGTWIDARHVVFQIDWAKTHLDVLAADATTVAARPWNISGLTWQPTAADVGQILHLAGKATETEGELVRGGEAPKLEITSFEVPDGLHAGGRATLAVQIANRGPGAAYRVAATTSSSMPALHGKRLEFGAIQPGAEKLRRVAVEVPSGETSPDAMVVLVVSEGNGFAPGTMSRRWPVSIAEPDLAMHCVIPEYPAAQPEIAAGTHVTVRCVVENSGGGAARAVLEVSINGATPTRSSAQDVLPWGRGVFVASIVIPRELAASSTVQLAITARDTRLGRETQTTLNATVGKPKLCDAGKLTRKQYDAKIRELRATVASGDMTQVQLDRYDAELILCLK